MERRTELWVVLLVSVLLVSSGCASQYTRHLEQTERLLDRGAEVDDSLSGRLHLGDAAFYGYAKTVRYLLEQGRDPNRRAQYGNHDTPLIWAAMMGHLEVVRILLGAGADPELRNTEGKSALDKAREQCGGPYSEPENYPAVVALLEQEERKRIAEAAAKKAREEQHIRAEIESAGLTWLIAKEPESAFLAEELTGALIRAKNNELSAFLARATVQERVDLLTAVELGISRAQSLVARLNAQAEDAVRQGQSAAHLREQAGKVQVYSGVLSAIRNMLLQS